MAYIGKEPADAFTSFVKQDFTTSATTSYTLDHSVVNENELALFINFVRQEPTAAYTASGTTLTLTSATASSDDMYCIYLGKAVQTVNPPSGSVGTAQLADDAVTKAKTSNLMYPAFEANLSANQTSVADHVLTKIQFDEERFDTDGCYDNSTNYRFTPTTAGKYFVYSYFVGGAGGGNADNKNTKLNIYKNGSAVRSVFNLMNTGYENEADLTINAVVDMNGSSDYLEIFASINSVANSGSNNFQADNCSFGAYRIGD